MAYTTVNKSGDYFNTKLYTGNYSDGHAITGVGFQPDWVWIKDRGDTSYHILTDAVRGATKSIFSNTSDAESTNTSHVQSFNSDGFTVGQSNAVNQSGVSNVSWNWKANGAGSSNSDGSVSATLSASATAGFSISTFTTPGSGTFTVGHGLGVAPKMVIYRPTGSSSWQVGHDSLGWTNFVALNNNGASASNTAFGNTAPTTSVWTGNTANVGANAPCVAYCFAEKTGYSKFGLYKGNGNTDGTFVYTGFRPAWLIIKKTSNNGSWYMYDNKRPGYNTTQANSKSLLADTTDPDFTSNIDLVSNGFKIRTSGSGENQSGESFIYLTFGQSIVGSNNVPAVAR